jgi:SAM-dependent methyltransferase
MDAKSHWESIYTSRAPTELSWYQARPLLSLQLIRATGIGKDQPIIDVGGGDSVLVDCLLEAGYTRLAVLDISAAALARARQRLGPRAASVQWLEADVTGFRPPHSFALWHDRAAFHFLTEASDRQRYVRVLREALLPGGHLIIATFAPQAPPRCSGLDVVRYDAAKLCAELGEDFELAESCEETHRTPWQTTQQFLYCRFRRRSG